MTSAAGGHNSGMEPEMKPNEAEVQAQEQKSERLWKTPNTLDAEGLAAAEAETEPQDVGAEQEGLESVRWEGAEPE